MECDRTLPTSDQISTQTTKMPTADGWLFLQINDLPESSVERAMGIEPTAPFQRSREGYIQRSTFALFENSSASRMYRCSIKSDV